MSEPAFEEIHGELRAVARELLGHSPASAPDWELLARSGWLGLEVPESLDGAGATFAEVAVILEEMGRAAASGPYLGSVVFGVGALSLAAPGRIRDETLHAIATGDLVVAVALTNGDDDAESPAPFGLELVGDTVVVRGEAAFTLDAPSAGRLLLLADHPVDGPVLVSVDADRGECSVVEQPVLDLTRRLGIVTAEGVEIDDDAVLRFPGNAAGAVARLHERAALAIAVDSLGLSEAMLDATVAYAGMREQFGRPIGSFQAVKHACADMYVAITVARALCADAVAAVVRDADDAATLVSMAKSYTSAHAVDVAGKAMQLHGGIGYTWDSPVHVYLKRAALNRSLFGSPGAHRRRIASRYST